VALRAGKLDHRVTLVRDGAVSYGSRGEPESIREEIATVWAQVEPLGGTEAELAQQLSPVGRVRLTLRYSTDVEEISPSHWFELPDRLGNTRKLQIEQIVERDERSEVLRCVCSETILEEALASS